VMPTVDALRKALRLVDRATADIECVDSQGRQLPNIKFELHASKFVPA
jgi:hypothetical protein